MTKSKCHLRSSWERVTVAACIWAFPEFKSWIKKSSRDTNKITSDHRKSHTEITTFFKLSISRALIISNPDRDNTGVPDKVANLWVGWEETRKWAHKKEESRENAWSRAKIALRKRKFNTKC